MLQLSRAQFFSYAAKLVDPKVSSTQPDVHTEFPLHTIILWALYSAYIWGITELLNIMFVFHLWNDKFGWSLSSPACLGFYFWNKVELSVHFLDFMKQAEVDAVSMLISTQLLALMPQHLSRSHHAVLQNAEWKFRVLRARSTAAVSSPSHTYRQLLTFGCGLFWRGSGVGNLVLSLVVKGCRTFKRRAITSCLAMGSSLSYMLHHALCHEGMQPRHPLKEPVLCNLDFHPLTLWAKQTLCHDAYSALGVSV